MPLSAESERLTTTLQSQLPLIIPSNQNAARKIEISRNPGRNSWTRSQLEMRRSSLISIGSTVVTGTRIVFYRLSDVLVTLLILLPLTVGFWRGVWQIMDHYCKEFDLGPWLSITIGNLIPLFFYTLQEPLKRYVHPSKMNYSIFYIITRFLLFLHAFASINQWRALWTILDTEYGFGWISQVVSLAVGVVLLIQLKLFCNTLAIPLFVGVDEADSSIHDCPLRYATPPESKFKYFLDCVYSIVVVQSLVVAAWRGLWNLATLYIYPEDELMSAIATTVLGGGIVVILCLLQSHYYKCMKKLKGLKRLATFDFVTMVGFVGTVLSWKGTWDLCNILVKFETPLRSEWVTTAIGGFGSLLLGCISTVVIRGVTIDGVDSTDGSSEWPISYVSLLQKKHHNVPFPEPWVCRCCFTSQVMKPKTSHRDTNLRQVDFHRVPNLKSTDKTISRTEGTQLQIIKIHFEANPA